jgi:hypothetical protein
MGANAGPDIVSDGLVLALEAADNNSFRGEPTVNVINGGANRANVVTTPISVGNHASISKSTSLTSYSSDRPNVLRYTSTNNTGYSMLNQQFSIQNQSGTTYTYSFEYKQLAGASNALQYSVVYKDGYKSPDSGTAASSISNTQIDLEDGWKRWILTYTSTYTGYNYIRFNIFTGGHLGTGDGDFDFYFDNFMLQEGSKRTRFVHGTRGTTVAAGGGWADISGNDNHGEILNGTTTSDDGSVLGALDFDGTNDYVDLGTQLNDLTVFTVEGVFKTDITGGADTFQVIFGAGPTNTSNYTNISIGNLTGSYPDESFHVVLKANTLQFYVRNGANFYFDQKYHHFVVNTEANKNAVYIDGVEQSLTYAQGSSAVDWGGINALGASNQCAIGRRSYNGGDGYFNGNIPLIRVYNRSLTEKEILANYNSLKTRFGL